MPTSRSVKTSARKFPKRSLRFTDASQNATMALRSPRPPLNSAAVAACGVFRRRDSRSESRIHRTAQEIHWPHDEQRRGILRTHRGARLRAIASHSRVTHRERFGTAGETYARRVQSEERRFETALRAREK